MRKDYYFFLVLLMAAAVITGSTLNLKTNFNNIIKNSPKIIQSDIKALDSTVRIENTQTSLQEKRSINVSRSSIEISEDDLRKNDQGILEEFLQVFFNTQNIINTKDSLLDFQKQHALNPTGQIDDLTLKFIINEAKTQRAKAILSVK